MKHLHFSWKYALIIVLVGLAGYLMMEFNYRMEEMRRLSVQRDDVAGQLEYLYQEGTQLAEQIAEATKEAAVVEWAYTKGHMIRPGDQLVVPLSDGGAAPVATATPPPEAPRLKNWQMWLLLFVDEIAP